MITNYPVMDHVFVLKTQDVCAEKQIITWSPALNISHTTVTASKCDAVAA